MGLLKRLLGTCLLGACLDQSILAQVVDPPAPEAVLSIDAAAQPLAQALANFAERTGLQLVYVSRLAGGKRSHPLPAGLAPAPALAKLLEGTGLAFVYLNERTIKIYAAPAVAARIAPASADSSREDHATAPAEALDEVMVTATKREQRLSILPMSASVLSAAEMYSAGIEDITEIAAVTPGIEYDFSSQFGPGILTNIAIRGISADKGQPTTGIYIDDTPIQMPHNSFGDPFPVTFDLARVEVLRGPQGTLFGSSAEGGAIRFIPNEPSTTDFDALYRAQISTTEQGSLSYELGAAAGGPLIPDTLGARVSAWYREEGGYVNREDPFTGAVVDADANRTWSEALRIALAIAPTDTLRITPSLSYQAGHVHDSPVFYTYLSDPSAGQFNSGRLLRQPDEDSFTLASLKVEQQLDGSLFTAVTSYFDRTASAIVDTTNEDGVTEFNGNGYGNPLGPEYPSSYADAVPSDLAIHQILSSQELRLASSDPTARLSWVAGLFYSRLQLDESQYEYLVEAPMPPASTGNNYSIDTEVSGYGQATWHFSPQWSTGAGMRLGWARGVNTGVSGGFFNAPSPASHTERDANLPPTPRFDLSFLPSDGQLYYISVAKGFRRGGTNGTEPSPCNGDPDTYAPDTVWSFELGAKNEFFARRLQISTSAYNIEWRGIQEGVNDACGNTYTANAGSAVSAGFDLKAEALLSDRLSMALALGYIDVQYTHTLIGSGDILIADRGAVVGGVPSVPAPWSGTLSVRYEWMMGPSALGYMRVDDTIHSHNPGPFTELDHRYTYYDPRYTADPATDLLNPQLGLKWAALDLKLFVTNALNQHPDLQLYADAPYSTLVYAYTLQPRTLGLTANWKF
ncbi:MAG: TonB-dependent receptor [Steroidobacteraceae bacterium]